MDLNIQKIIDELIKIDSSFQEKKEELEKLISKIIKSKPNFEINPAFVVELKEKLHNAAETKKQNIFSNLFTMKTFQSFGAGALLTALILTPLFYSMWGMTQSTQKLAISEMAYDDGNIEIMEETEFFADESMEVDGIGGLAQNSIMVNSLGSNAFGKLSSQNSGETTDQVRNQSEGGMAKLSSNDAAPMIATESAVSSKMIMPYNPIQYKYIVDQDIELEKSEITVLRRKTGSSDINANVLLKALNLELVDSSVFKNVTAQNISIKENREFGYTINISNENGTNSLSIYKNWEKWPNPNDKCNDSVCYEKNRLKAKDMPTNEKLIAIANAFTKKLHIDMSPYGQPVVNENYKTYIVRDSSDYYIPDEIIVTYPIKIEDQEVMDERGNLTGLNINIDIRHTKASGLNGLTFQEYDSANYQTVSLEKLKAAIERGTYHQNNYYPKDAKIVEIKLGKPEKVLSKIWYWNKDTNKSSELLVPALYFSILEAPKSEEHFNRDAIVIPLAEDLYEESDKPMPVLYKGVAEPMIEPMMIQKGEESAQNLLPTNGLMEITE